MLKGLLEDSHEVSLVLNQVLHQIGEETIEDLEACIYLHIFIGVHESKQQVQKILPDESVLLVESTTYFNDQVANLVNDCFVGTF